MSLSQNQRAQQILTNLEKYGLDLSNVEELESDTFEAACFNNELARTFPNIYSWYIQLRAIRTIETHNVLTQLTTASPFILEKARNGTAYMPTQVDRFQLHAHTITIPELPVSLRDLTTELYFQIYDYQHYISGIGNQTVLGFSEGSGKLSRILDVGLARYIGFNVNFGISFDLRTGTVYWYNFEHWDERELLDVLSLHDVQVGTYHSYL
jgi:hypothetical protein